MKIDVEDAISSLQDDIEEKRQQIEVIKSIDWTQSVTEDQWHAICETPLRGSDLLGVLVKNIFPNADDIIVHCNYIYFNLYGFKVQIPTSLCQGLNIDLSWWHKDYGEPEIYPYGGTTCRMKQYFEEVDRHADWYTLATLRLGEGWRKWILWIMWWFKYKWKNPHREEWENKFKDDKDRYEIKMEKYRQEMMNIENKVNELKEKLLPEINKFSTKHFAYNGEYGQPEIGKVLNK